MVLRYVYGIVVMVSILLIGGCSKGVLDPGDIARPLAGVYRLESRTYVAQDSARTILGVEYPPERRAYLTLTSKGRYGVVDTLAINNDIRVFTSVGRWSVLDGSFFVESDDNLSATYQFTYDGARLVRILPDQITSSNIIYSIVDVWLKIPL